MTIYFSNRHSHLLQYLKENLFARGIDLFAKKIVIVPNAGVDQYIRFYLAKELGIATGFKTYLLDSFVDLICGQKVFPNELDLIFRIEEAIDEIQDAPLCDYLQRNEKRKMPLCTHLAALFAKLALHGFRDEVKGSSWQERLFQKVFSVNPYALILQNLPPCDAEIHLFGFSHLSDFHFTFIKAYSPKIYHLSPCEEFWSDIKTDHEIARFLKSKEMKSELEARVEELLSDRNPLLANFGKLHRSFAMRCEEENFQTVEEYQPNEKKSHLAQIQNALLTFSKVEKALEDDSIVLHSFQTPAREIEGLLQHITSLRASGEVSLRECIVLAPDISEYAPFIRSAFEGIIPYQIHHLKLLDNNILMQGLLLAFDLEKKKWELGSVFEWLSHPGVRSKLELKEEEIAKAKEWMTKAHVRWGFNQEHVRKLSGKETDATHSTWMQGFDRLLCHLATSSEISLSEVSILEKCITALSSLYKALEPLHSGVERTMESWINVIEEIVATFFLYEESERGVLTDVFLDLKVSKKKYSSHAFRFLLNHELSKLSYTEKSQRVESLNFASLYSMGVTSAKMIFLIGMNQGAFPRREKNQHGLRAGPSRGDLDRSAFLEALLSASDKVYISYQGRDPVDQTALLPSTCVLSLGVKKIKEHPLFGFDSRLRRSQEPFKLKASEVTIEPGEYYLNFKDLVTAVKNPLKLFFRETLHVKLRKPEMQDETHDFLLSPLQMKEIKTEVMQSPLENVLSKAVHSGNFPQHLFSQVATLRVHDEIDHLQTVLNGRLCQKREWEEINLKLDDSRTVFLSGSIEHCFDHGIFVFEKCGLKTALRYLPQLCVLSLEKKAQIVFGKDGKELLFPFEEPFSYLRDLCEYYFYCKRAPSFLFPSWVEPILEGDVKGLEKEMEEKCYEEELKFALRYDMLPTPSEIIESSKMWSEKLYRGVYSAWF